MKNGLRLVIYIGVVIGVATLLFNTLKGRSRTVPRVAVELSSSRTVDVSLKSDQKSDQQLGQQPGQLPGMMPSSVSDASSVETKRQVQILGEVLMSRNDNDPRLDRELKVLAPEARERFRLTYRHMAPEARNQRGTIVFLLGRNLETPEDFAFFRDVLAEAPCLSLSDCSKPASRPETQGAHDSEHEHRETATATTLNYPSLMALKSLERELKRASTFKRKKSENS